MLEIPWVTDYENTCPPFSKNILFIVCYFWLCWAFVAAWAFLQLTRVGATFQEQCAGFSMRYLLWIWSRGSRAQGLLQLQLPGFRAQAQQLWCMGFVGPWHVGSSRVRDRTHVSCIGWQILYHWATGGAQHLPLYDQFFPTFWIKSIPNVSRSY